MERNIYKITFADGQCRVVQAETANDAIAALAYLGYRGFQVEWLWFPYVEDLERASVPKAAPRPRVVHHCPSCHRQMVDDTNRLCIACYERVPSALRPAAKQGKNAAMVEETLESLALKYGAVPPVR